MEQSALQNKYKRYTYIVGMGVTKLQICGLGVGLVQRSLINKKLIKLCLSLLGTHSPVKIQNLCCDFCFRAVAHPAATAVLATAVITCRRYMFHIQTVLMH